MPNLKFVPLAISDLLTFNAQKFAGSHERGHASFYPLLTCRVVGHHDILFEL